MAIFTTQRLQTFLPRTAFAAAALATAFALFGCGGPEARRASHMSRGQMYFAEGKLEKARIEFRNVLQIAPNDAQARFMSGRVAEKLGDLRGAVGFYQAALDADGNHVLARANLGRILVFGDVPERALEVVEPGLLQHPDDPELLTVRGAARVRLKDYAGALADAERAVRVAPGNENAAALLASLYQQRGQPDRGIELLKATLARVPESVDLRQILASLYVATSQPPLAEEQLRAIVRLRPRDLKMRYQLASFYVGAKRLDAAEAVLKDSMTAFPDDNDAKLAYVEFVAAHRSREQGEALMKELIGRRPDDYDFQLGLGALELRAGATDKAIAIYRAVIERDRTGQQGLAARKRIAAIDASAGRYDEALSLVSEVLQNNSRDDDALTIRGNIALQRGDLTGAISDLRAVVRDQPAATAVLRSLARAHLANGEPALAEENLRSALRAAPTDPTVNTELAQLLTETQRADQAIAVLQEAVRAMPKDAGLRDALVRACLAKPDREAARSAIKDLEDLAPQLAAGPYLAGLLAQAENHWEEAEKDFEQALHLQPDSIDALTALVQLQLAHGQTGSALARVRDVVARQPQSAPALNLLGELCLAAPQEASNTAAAPRCLEEANSALNRAIASAPKWWLPYRNLARSRLEIRDLAGAAAAAEAGVRETSDTALITDLAAIYELQGRVEEAIRQYETLHKRNPRSELAANNLAMLLVTYRKDPVSLDRARELTNTFADSSDPALLDTHGWVRFKRGEVAEALPALERAAAQRPESKVIRYHLGMAQLKAGQRDKAASSLESALAGAALFPGSDEARAALAQLRPTRG